jgi:hypothetical protein
MTIVTGADGLGLGITAGHVADKIRSTKLAISQLGAGHFDPGSLIQRSRYLDLATFRLPRAAVVASGHKAFRVRSWPLPPLRVRDLVLFGGHPGSLRNELPDKYDVAFLWFATLAESVSETNIGFALNISASLSAGPERLPEDADLGGCSGGPVFRLTETPEYDGGLDVKFELVGTIYEYNPGFGILFAHGLTSLRGDGRFDE